MDTKDGKINRSPEILRGEVGADLHRGQSKNGKRRKWIRPAKPSARQATNGRELTLMGESG
jgi:hypothetical protein